MSRKRQLSSAIWTDKDFVPLSFGARLLYLGLLSHADDEGRMSADSLELKLKVFPADSVSVAQVAAFLAEIRGGGLVALYQFDGGAFLAIRNWTKYQTLNWVTPSKLPAPPDGAFNHTTKITVIADCRTDVGQNGDSTKGAVPSLLSHLISTKEGVQGEPTPKAKASRNRKSELLDPDKAPPVVRRLWFAHLAATDRKGGVYALTEARSRTLENCVEWSNGDVDLAETGVKAIGASDFHRGNNDRKTRYDTLEDAPFRSRVAFAKWLEGAECARRSDDMPPEAIAYRRAVSVLTAMLPDCATVAYNGGSFTVSRTFDGRTLLRPPVGRGDDVDPCRLLATHNVAATEAQMRDTALSWFVVGHAAVRGGA